MSTIITEVPAAETFAGDVVLSVPAHTIVATGEYADQGEPDILVRVSHAVDADGNDISAVVAKRIAKVLGEFTS